LKSLEKKLRRIRSGKYSQSDFIIADAKDGDMAFGVTAPGPVSEPTPGKAADRSSRWKPKSAYLNAMEEMTQSKLIDIMLMSVSSAESLKSKATFHKSPVTPAVRLNDTTDIWNARGSSYRQHPSEPFATADLESVKPLCKLGLYSMTFSNDLKSDKASLDAYREFRLRARDAGIKHFLEIFNPAFDIGIADDQLGHYINDMIIKAVAGVSQTDAPLFLKIQFNGAKAMEELTQYDPQGLIAGILGGAAGTSRDTFELALQAENSGARVALFGRKINLAESPVELVKLMRQTIEGRVTPTQAVKNYHEHLKQHGIKP